LPGGRAARNSGTSFAAPHVAGTIALILSADPSLTASEAVDILLESSTPLAEGCDPRFGAGLVDAGAAVATASAAGR
ncbi:MAG TPA: S8 family serine peptidase, partial [Candidatus Bipolaricaulis anaerobius]|nr:S8 family serine peptidase [Candidatus Bipolaricaulis anaerobius]